MALVGWNFVVVVIVVIVVVVIVVVVIVVIVVVHSICSKSHLLSASCFLHSAVIIHALTWLGSPSGTYIHLMSLRTSPCERVIDKSHWAEIISVGTFVWNT